MNTRARLVVTSLVVLLAAATASSLLRHRSAERRLAADWNRTRERAQSAGLTLDGLLGARSGWPFGAAVTIDRPTLRSPDGRLLLSADRLILCRPRGPDGVTLRLEGPATVFVGDERWQVWGDRVEARVRPERIDTVAAGLRLSAGGGPDEVVTAERAVASLDRQRLTLGLDHLVLPLAGAPAPERVVARAGLAGRLAGRAFSFDADADWGGSSINVAGTLGATPAGPISGRLGLTLGAGWRDAIGRARSAHLLTADQAQAATGLLSLLAPRDLVRDLPLAVERGRVTLAGLLLFSLPDLPPERAARDR